MTLSSTAVMGSGFDTPWQPWVMPIVGDSEPGIRNATAASRTALPSVNTRASPSSRLAAPAPTTFSPGAPSAMPATNADASS